jgi:Domain of unknown function (DUF4926)
LVAGCPTSSQRTKSEKMNRPNELDNVALISDLPEFGLKAGHVGTVIFVHERDALEVEFFDLNGDTHALLTLNDWDVRKPSAKELDVRNAPDPRKPGTRVPWRSVTSRVRP